MARDEAGCRASSGVLMDDTECCLEREREGGRDDALDEGLESSIEASEGVLERLRLCADREGSDARYARFLML